MSANGNLDLVDELNVPDSESRHAMGEDATPETDGRQGRGSSDGTKIKQRALQALVMRLRVRLSNREIRLAQLETQNKILKDAAEKAALYFHRLSLAEEEMAALKRALVAQEEPSRRAVVEAELREMVAALKERDDQLAESQSELSRMAVLSNEKDEAISDLQKELAFWRDEAELKVFACELRDTCDRATQTPSSLPTADTATSFARMTRPRSASQATKLSAGRLQRGQPLARERRHRPASAPSHRHQEPVLVQSAARRASSETNIAQRNFPWRTARVFAALSLSSHNVDAGGVCSTNSFRSCTGVKKGGGCTELDGRPAVRETRFSRRLKSNGKPPLPLSSRGSAFISSGLGTVKAERAQSRQLISPMFRRDERVERM